MYTLPKNHIIGMLRIVQVSLLGSILSNILLVLGCAFFAGGMTRKTQHFSAAASSVNAAVLMLCGCSLSFPMIIDLVDKDVAPGVTLAISRIISIILLIVYAAYIYFQLVTHSFLYTSERIPLKGQEEDTDFRQGSEKLDDDEEEEAVLGVSGSVFWLAVITIIISILSEYMVDSLEEAAATWGVPDLFLGTIIIPIVGNAAEHAAAIIFAVKNKMELALGIAVGSSIQIGLFCMPSLVLTAWALDYPLSLNFGSFEATTFLMTVFIASVIIQLGQSNWMQGLLLLAAYASIATSFFVHVDPK